MLTQSSLYSLIVPLLVFAANDAMIPFYFFDIVEGFKEGTQVPSEVITQCLKDNYDFFCLSIGLKFYKAVLKRSY